MKASDLFVDCLEHEGAEYIFGLPGEETTDIMGSLINSKIKFVLTRHEQAAAFMADVVGRLTGKAGVCLSTLGPGATNLMTGVADANLDGAPIVAVTAQAGRERMHKESHQYIDLVRTFYPITKWNTSIRDAAVIPEIVRKAFRIAEIERPGATHIEFPEDAMRENADGRPLAISEGPIYHPTKAELERAAGIIRSAKYPIILAGNGVIRAKASKNLLEFSESNRIPVVNTFMSKGVVPHDSELSLYTVGLQMKDYVMCGFDRADVVIAAGYDFVEYGPRNWNPNRDKKIIHVASRRSEIDAYYEPAAELVGDLRGTLDELTGITGTGKGVRYTERLKSVILKELGEKTDDPGFPVKPQRLVSGIRAAMHHDDILVSDVGMHKLWIARMFPTYVPNTVMISNGFASMGFGIPGGIAAKLIYPGKRVVVATGDGGFMMNSQEIETAKRLGVNISIVIFHDNELGSIAFKQKNLKKRIGVEFGNPDFVKYAESFGAEGHKVERADDLENILKEAVKAENVVVIDVPVDYSENLMLLNKLGRAICPV